MIVPLNDFSMFPLIDDVYDADKSPYYEFKEHDPIPESLFSHKLEWEIEQFQKSGVTVVYVTADVRRALIRAEQQADVIIYDSYQCETPPIKTDDEFCMVTEEVLRSVRSKSYWPGLRNCDSSRNIALLAPTMSKEREDLYRSLFKGRNTVFVMTKYIPEDVSGMEVMDHSVLAIDETTNQGVSRFLAIHLDATEVVDPSLFLVEGLDLKEKSIVATFQRAASPCAEVEQHTNETMAKLAQTINKSDADVVIVSINIQKDIEGIYPGKQIIYTTPEIDDQDDAVYKRLAKYFDTNNKPPLQMHFEGQVDILMSMSTASDKELYVSNNDSSNRESFCRLFLSSTHRQGSVLPPVRLSTACRIQLDSSMLSS